MNEANSLEAVEWLTKRCAWYQAEIDRLRAAPPALQGPRLPEPTTELVLRDLETRIFYASTGVEALAEAARYWRTRAEELERLQPLPALHGLIQSWRAIESAPKDGTWCLGWNEDCGCFVWRDGPGLMTGEDPAPTHWMPLSPPPQKEDTK